jgi:hypothetical protein
MFADSGCCVPYENALCGLEVIKGGFCEIAHGSRKLESSKINNGQTLHRRVYSWIFRKVVGWYMRIPEELTDTQCGFKVYHGDVGRKLYGESVSDGFMFDVEIICRALKKGYRIREFAIEWTCDCDSRLSVRRNFFQLYSELRNIKKMLKRC